jgi:hypothetical protein
VGKRSAKFLGSKMWRKRDVSVQHTTLSGVPALRAVDMPTGISRTAAEDEPTILRNLAHRVHQFE